MHLSGNTVLITGGGSGIGEALAHRLHDLDNTVIIAGRRKEALEAATSGRSRMHWLTLDVETPESIAAFAERVVAEYPAVNALINNAGIMRTEVLDRSRDLSDAEATITTNLLGPIRLTNALIDHLIGQPNAWIMNVSSGLAFVPLVSSPTYSATKAAIHSYTATMREALKGKVEVVELVPPLVQTELTPGQSKAPVALALPDFVNEVVTLLQQQPTPAEIVVQRAAFQRFAEAENRFDTAVSALNERDRAARASRS